MPTHLGGLRQDHPSKVEKIKLILSSEMKNKGKSAMKDVGTAFTPSDSEILGASITTATSLPTSVGLALPIAQNQGAEGACCAFSSTYARSIEYYYNKGANSFSNSVNVFSPEYTYDYTKFSDCASGTSYGTCLDLMVNKGVCLWNTLPYDDTNGCAVTVASPFDAAASAFRIGGYAKLLHTDRAAIKNQLANNHPVMIGVSADNSFTSAGANFIWSTRVSGALPHAILIVGYDDALNAYKVLNSWGTGWGDSGTSHIDYDFFETDTGMSYYAYVITDAVQISSAVPIANAGYGQTIPSTSSAILDGSASYSPNGYIASYAWSLVSGPNSPTITNPTASVANASGMIAGTYIFQLTVTDNSSVTASATVTIIVTGVAESITLATPVKSTLKGKTYDTVSWIISLNTPPQSAELQTGSSSTVFAFLYPITTMVSSYKYLVNAKKTRYYRVKVLKADGTIAYSNVVSKL